MRLDFCLYKNSRAILERKDTKKSAEATTTDVEIVDVSCKVISPILDAHLACSNRLQPSHPSIPRKTYPSSMRIGSTITICCMPYLPATMTYSSRSPLKKNLK